MAKRFTDSEKWNHSWFRKLSPKHKCAWVYLLDKCDHAGIWIADFEAMAFNIGEEISELEFCKIFHEKIIKVEPDKFIVNAFIDFQYGKLNPNNKVHKSVIEKLSKIQGAIKEYASPLQGAKDKDKEEDKVKEKEKAKETSEIPNDILQSIKITMQYPDEIIEEIRKDAWIKYQASDKPDKNWKRFIANYIVNEKEAIRNLAIDRGKVIKKQPANNQAREMASKIYNQVLRNGIHGLKETLKSLTPLEIKALEKFGLASEIINCPSDFQATEIKNRLKAACEEVIKLRSGEVDISFPSPSGNNFSKAGG
jgi:hypothetical protein